MKTIVFCLTIICFELSSSFPYPDELPRYYGSYEPVGVPEQRGISQQLQSNIAHSQNSELAPTLSYQQQQLAYIQQENIRRQNYENLWRIQENERQVAARNQRLADQLKIQSRPIEQYNSPVLNTVREPYSNSVPLQQPIQQNQYEAPITQPYYPAQQNQQYAEPYLRQAPQQYQVQNKPQAVAQSGPVQQNNPYQQYQPQPQYNAQNQAYHPRVQQALASSPHKKRYLVLHPNGTVEHIDKIDSIVQKYPNYILMNAGDYQRNDVANAKVQGPTPPIAWNRVNYPQQPVAPVAPKPPVAPTPPVASAVPVRPAAPEVPAPVAPGTPVAQASAGPVARVVPPVPTAPVGPAKPVAPVEPATPGAATAQTSAGPVRATPVAPTAPAAPVVSAANANAGPVTPASPVATPAPVAQIPAPYPVKPPTPVPSPKTPLPPVAPGVISSPVIQNGTVPPGPKPTVKPPSDPTTTLRPETAPTAQPPRVVTATASAGSGNATAVASAETKPDVPSEASADVKPTPENNASAVAPRKPDAVANATVVTTGPKHDLDLLQVNSKTEPVVWFRTKDLDFWDKLTSGNETFDILYFFNIPREPRVNRDTKTTVHPNGTVVEEITQFIYDDEDSPPRIVKTTKVTLLEKDQPIT